MTLRTALFLNAVCFWLITFVCLLPTVNPVLRTAVCLSLIVAIKWIDLRRITTQAKGIIAGTARENEGIAGEIVASPKNMPRFTWIRKENGDIIAWLEGEPPPWRGGRGKDLPPYVFSYGEKGAQINVELKNGDHEKAKMISDRIRYLMSRGITW